MTKSASCNIADVKFRNEVLALRSAAMDAARIRGTRGFPGWMVIAAFLAAAQRDILPRIARITIAYTSVDLSAGRKRSLFSGPFNRY
jgi:hypothetical protein